MSCDVALKLPCGVEVPVVRQILQLASPFFRGALEDMSGSAPIPVDGSLGAWTYILSDLYPLHDAPPFTWVDVYMLLPVVHKYNFTKLLKKLVAVVKGNSEELSSDPSLRSTYVICWVALAEWLQLDELREVCLSRLRGMSQTQLEQAILIPGAHSLDGGGVREDVKRLGHALCFDLLSITAKKRDTVEARTGARGQEDGGVEEAWRIEGFSKLTNEIVRPYCFEAGIGTWCMRVDPNGCGGGKDTHLSVYLALGDAMWAPLSAEFELKLVNQVDSSKSISKGTTMHTLSNEGTSWGYKKIIELSELRDAAANWLLNDTLVLTVDLTVQREDRFQLDTGGMPCDVTLKLQCGVELLILQPAPSGGLALLPRRSGEHVWERPNHVDGSLGAWTYIVSDLFPQYDAPPLTLGSVYVLLPVVHKYNFPKLLKRLVAFVEENSDALSPRPSLRTGSNYVILWLALAERLQMDELRELCLDRLRGMTRKQLDQAILFPDAGNKCGVREEVKRLGPALCFELPAIGIEK
ncbi:hypothetical protein FOA52_000520 [Chlamydomonas sp. UWO 241]|nr:hypothetical protein FOA52_000520 [Chlamydomonas sp. UWO 241]